MYTIANGRLYSANSSSSEIFLFSFLATNINKTEPRHIKNPASKSVLCNYSLRMITEKMVLNIIEIELVLDSNIAFPKPNAITFETDPTKSIINPNIQIHQ